MTRIHLRRPAAFLALAIAAPIILGTAAVSSAAKAKPLPQRFTLFSANVRGKDVPMAVEAAGQINGIGTETQTDKDTPGGQTNHATLHFAGGTLRLVAPEQFDWKANLRTCSATASGGGTFTIEGGTGAYRGATGKGTFTAHGVLIGARSKSGTCLGENAPPAANYVTVTAVGTIALRG
jgi:hypothetical protein